MTTRTDNIVQLMKESGKGDIFSLVADQQEKILTLEKEVQRLQAFKAKVNNGKKPAKKRT